VESIELLECVGISTFGFFNGFGFIETGCGGSSDGGLGECACRFFFSFFSCCNDVTLSKFDARELLPVVSDCKD
jgi:hypothetical protein